MLERWRVTVLLPALVALLGLAPSVLAHDDGYVSPAPTIPSRVLGPSGWFAPGEIGFWLVVSGVLLAGASLYLVLEKSRQRKRSKSRLLPMLLVVVMVASTVPFASPTTPQQPYSTPTSTSTVNYSENFSSGYDRGWSVQPGIPGTPSVQVVLDGGTRVMGARGSSGGGFIVNYLEGEEWQNVLLQARVKAINGSDQFIDFRRTWTASNFTTYQLILAYGAGQVQLGKFLQAIPRPANLTIVAVSNYALTLGAWYTVAINATGNRIIASLNNQKLIDYTDPAPLLSGTIGFEAGDPYSAINVGYVSVTASVPYQSSWQQLNGPDGGQIGNIAIDPSNPSIVYAAAIHTGLMKSTNRGDYWREVAYSSGVGGTKVADVALAPSNSSIVYITILDTASGGGAWKSVDGGQHWRQLLKGNPGFYLFSIAVSPTDPNLVYAGTQTGLVPGSEGTASIYRSADGGDTWKAVYTAQVQHIVISKSDPNTIYVGSGDQGVLKSTDGGATWKQMNAGIRPSDIPPGSAAPRVDRIVVDPANSNAAMIHLGDVSLGGRDPNPGTVYVTNDGGRSWTLAVPDLSPSQLPVAIGMAPSNSRILYVGGVDFDTGTGLVWRSSDQGGTWAIVNSGAVVGIPQEITVDPGNPSLVYMGTLSKGVYRSQDGGATWTRAETGFVGGGVYAVAVDPANNNIMFASDGVSTWANEIPFHGYLTKSTDGGITWADVPNSPGRVSVIRFDPTNPSVIYLGTGGPSSPDSNGTGVYKSTDGGSTWLASNTGMENASISSLVINSSNTGVLLAGTGHRPYSGTEGSGIFRSTDGGRTWKKVSFPNLSVPAIVIDPSNPSVAYAATMGQGVYKSTDGGLNWSRANSGIGDLMIYSLAIGPGQQGTLYAGSSPFYGNEQGLNGVVYKTTSGGAKWEAVFSPGDVEWIFVDPLSPNQVYVVEHAGHWYWTPDGGTNWLEGSQTLTRLGGHAYPFAATLDARSHSLYVGTCGRGVFINHLTRMGARVPTWLKVHYSSGTFNTLFESNTSLVNFEFDQTLRSLTFTVAGNAGTRAEANITIPTDTLAGPYTVTVDGSPVTPTLSGSTASGPTHVLISYLQNGKQQRLVLQASLAATATTTTTQSSSTTSSTNVLSTSSTLSTTSSTASPTTSSTSASSTSSTLPPAATTTAASSTSLSSATTSQSTFSSATSTVSLATSSSATSGGGGIPEFPPWFLAVSVFTTMVVVSYLTVRGRRPRRNPIGEWAGTHGLNRNKAVDSM